LLSILADISVDEPSGVISFYCSDFVVWNVKVVDFVTQIDILDSVMNAIVIVLHSFDAPW